MEIGLKTSRIGHFRKQYRSHDFVRPILQSFNVPTIKSVKSVIAAAISTTVGLSQTFHNLKQQGKVAFIPYIMAGDPDLATTAKALKVLDSCGSAMIELGVPCSDPSADGPVIQASAARSLAEGTNFEAIISMLKEVVPQLSCPILLFTYHDPILTQGVEKFMTSIKDAGVHGLLVPDIRLEETNILREEANKKNIEFVLLATVTTPQERMKAIVDASGGFMYLVLVDGVTGVRTSVNPKVKDVLKNIKEKSNKPVAVGFGLSKPEHLKLVAGWGADGVIVGSAIVKVLGEAKSPEQGIKQLETFTKSLISALP